MNLNRTVWIFLFFSSRIFAADMWEASPTAVFGLHGGMAYRGGYWALIPGRLLSFDRLKKSVTVKAFPPYDAVYRIDVRTLEPAETAQLEEGLAANPDRFTVLFKQFDPESFKRIAGPGDLTIKELDPVRPDKFISYEELVRKARSSNDLNDFVLKIPDGALREFVLAHKSGSPQGASYDCPRVIRYSEDAKLILAYRGCGHQADPSAEIIRFDKNSTELKFSQVIFGRKGVTVSENLTHECFVCHQSNNRTLPSYIWGGYPNWPNMYGSANDGYLDAAEIETFLKFRRNQARNIPAYSALHWSNEDELFPFSTPSRKDRKTLNRVMVDRRPNKILTAALSRWKARQLAGAIERHEAFNRIKYLLLMDTLRCHDRRDTLSELGSALVLYTGKRIPLTQVPFREIWDLPRNEGTDIYRVSRALGLTAEDWNISVTDGPTPADHRNKPNYYFGALQLSANVIGNLLKDVVQTDFPEMKGRIRFFDKLSYFFGRTSLLYGGTDLEVEALTDTQRSRVCSSLKTRHESLRKVFARQDLLRKAKRVAVIEEMKFDSDESDVPRDLAYSRQADGDGVPPSLGHCIACHERGESAPPIPFNDSRELVERMKQAPFYGSKRTLLEESIARIDSRNMPPNAEISDSDREAIKTYLIGLSRK
jgi:hypothetical protein